MTTAFISGANRGLGLALARAFAARDVQVLAGVRDVNAYTGPGAAIEVNVRSAASVQAAAHAVESIDYLVNNAGVYVGGDLLSTDEEDFKTALDVNVLGPWRLTRALLPKIVKGGKVAMISSLSGLIGLPGDGAYAASKFALEGMSQSLAGDLAKHSVQLLLFAPGSIATSFGGSDHGMTADAAALEIIHTLARPTEALRHPCGDQARHVFTALETDTGTLAQHLVEEVTGIRWYKQAQRDEGPSVD